MPRAKKIPPVSPEDEKAWKEAPPTIMVHPDDEEMDNVFAGLPQGEQCIEIFRIKDAGGRPLYLESIQPPMFSLAYVSSKFGGGRYIAHGKYLDGQYVKMPFEIEGEPIPVRRIGRSNGAEPIPEAETRLLAALRQQNGGGGELESVGDETSPLVQVLIAMLKKNENSELQMLEKMQLYKNLFAPATQPAAPIEQVLAMFEKGLNYSGKGVEANPWIELVKEFRQPLEKAVDTVQLAIAAKRVTQPEQPAQPGQPRPPQGPPITEENMQLLLIRQIQGLIPVLAKGAVKDTDPASYVDLVLDQVPESAYAPLRDFLIKGDCLEILANYDANIRNFPAWYMSFRKQLLEALTEFVGNGLASVQSPENSEPATVNPAPSTEVS